MQSKNIGILGGSGFVGHHLCLLFANLGHKVYVLSRQPEKYPALQFIPGISIVKGDIFDQTTRENFFQSLDTVINLVGILNEAHDNGEDFQRVHVELTHHVILACEHAGVSRLLHMSALNADKNAGSYYLRSKGEAEEWVLQAGKWGLKVTCFRPSVIFGKNDSFFNRFAALLKLSPFAFPLACANTRFAPVYVGDVGRAFAYALENSETIGKCYDLCGPKSYTLKALLTYTAQTLQLKRIVIGIPDILSRLQARILGLLPTRPFTMDNYRSLQTDSTCTDNGFDALGIKPRSLETVVPTYLGNIDTRHPLNKYRRKIPFNHTKKPDA